MNWGWKVDWWSVAGTVFAGVAAAGWAWDKYVESRDRPKAIMTFRSNATMTRDSVIYDVLTVTNTGNCDAFLHQGLQVVNGGAPFEMHGHERPEVLRTGDSAQLFYTEVKPDETYARSTLYERRGVVIQWDPISNSSSLVEELLRQFDESRELPPRWVAGRRPPQFVGPGGVARTLIRSKWPEAEQRRRIGIAMGEIPSPEPTTPSRPRRVLVWLWNRYVAAKKRATRRSRRHEDST